MDTTTQKKMSQGGCNVGCDPSRVTTEHRRSHLRTVGNGCVEGVGVVIERDITMSEAARRLGVSRRTLLRHLREGRIPTAYQSEGGRWYIQPSGIAAWLEERGK